MINLKNISGSDYPINNLVVDPQVLDPANDGKILAGQVIDISVSLTPEQIDDSDQIFDGINNDILVFCDSNENEYSKEQSLVLFFNAPESFVTGINFDNNDLVLDKNNVYVDGGYTGTEIGTKENPFSTWQAGIDAANDKANIYMTGVLSSVVGPTDKSLFFIGDKDKTFVKFENFDPANGHLFEQLQPNCLQSYYFKDIIFENAGDHAICILSALKVQTVNCNGFNNGWTNATSNQNKIAFINNTTQTQADLQAFAASSDVSDGGFVKLVNVPVVSLSESDTFYNNSSYYLENCGIGGSVFLSRLQNSYNLSPVKTINCDNVTAYNMYYGDTANQGLYVEGGKENRFALSVFQNNWSSDVQTKDVSNTKFRDNDLTNSQRCDYNFDGSLVTKGSFNISGDQADSNRKFLLEVLDSQIHSTERITGLNICAIYFDVSLGNIGAGQNIINIDDVGLIGFDEQIDMSYVDARNLKITVGDNRSQENEVSYIKPPLLGNFYSKPFSNQVTRVLFPDFSRDNSLTNIIVKDRETNLVIDIYNINGLSVDVETMNLLYGGKIQLENLIRENISINGTLLNLGSDTTTANELNNYFSRNDTGGGIIDPPNPTLIGVPEPLVSGDNYNPAYITQGIPDGSGKFNLIATETGDNKGDVWSLVPLDQSEEFTQFQTDSAGGGKRFYIGFCRDDQLSSLGDGSGNANEGLQWSLAIYDGYNAPWTFYGDQSSYSYSEYFTNKELFRLHSNILNGKVTWKVGIDVDGKFKVYVFSVLDSEWKYVASTSYSLTGDNYHAVVRMYSQGMGFYDDFVNFRFPETGTPLTFYYIESPQGNYEYPLFLSEDEAIEFDTENGGTGQAVAYQYNNEIPVVQTYYMPESLQVVESSTVPPTTLSTYDEIEWNVVTIDNNFNFGPPAFVDQTINKVENEYFSLQVAPQDVTYTTTLSNNLPSGLSFNGFLISGTIPYVEEDQTFEIIVTRTNEDDSSTGVLTLNIQNSAALSNLTGWTVHQGNTFIPDNVLATNNSLLDFDTVLNQGEKLTWTQTNSNGATGGFGQYAQIGLLKPSVDKSIEDVGNATAPWEFRLVTWSSGVNNSNGANGVGWDDNSKLDVGLTNNNIDWELHYKSDGFVDVYRDGVLKITSLVSYSGGITISYATPAAYGLNTKVPLFVKSTIPFTGGAPDGFTLTSGSMYSQNVLGTDSVVTLDLVIAENKRFIIPSTFVSTNILPNLQASLNKAYIAVPKIGADYANIDLHTDFDAVHRWEFQSGDRHKLSESVGDSINANPLVINSATDPTYNFAIEWDGTNLHVIAHSSLTELNTRPAVINGGVFDRVFTYSNYDAVRTGNLPIVFATKTGGKFTLTTDQLSIIDIPLGQYDFNVVELGSTVITLNGSYPVGVTLQSDYTYRFYLTDSSIESTDTLTFETVSGSQPYTTGVTTNGTFGNYDYYVEFAIPSDVPPIKIVWNGTSNGVLNISGSTYVEPVTGVTLEGPAANQSGNVMLANSWLAIDETLSAGERIVFTAAFLAEAVAELSNSEAIFFGLKKSGWINTDITDGFAGGIYFYLQKVSNTDIRIYMVGGTGTSSTIFTTNTILTDMFIEVTSSGDNIRIGQKVITNFDDDPETTAYSEWVGNKRQTGAQGFGITSVDVVMFYLKATGSFDTANVDWTLLNEYAVPVAGTNLVTSHTKALDFTGSNQYAYQVSNQNYNNVLRMNSISSTVAAPSNSNNTSNSSNARPWAIVTIHKIDGNNSNQHIWNMGEGAGSNDDNIYLRLAADRKLYFGWGRDGSLNECTIGQLSTSSWYGLYIAHNGTRLTNPSATDLANMFTIRAMAQPTQWATLGSEISIASNWTTTGGNMTRSFNGQFSVGGRLSNRSFHGKINSVVVTTLKTNVAMPSDEEIKLMIKDPEKWVQDYKVGETFRRPDAFGTSGTFALNNINSARSTQVWTFENSLDAYALMRNFVYPADQNETALRMQSMQSNDIETVNIPYLTS